MQPDLDASLTRSTLIRWISSMEGDRVSASLADHRPHPPHWSEGSTVTPTAAISQSKIILIF